MKWRSEWFRYAGAIGRRGPTELGYAYFRRRRRRKNRADDDPSLSESDLLALSGGYDVDIRAVAANQKVLAGYEKMDRLGIQSIQWFLPHFAHAYYGGVYTILRFADHFARHYGVDNRFCIYDGPIDENSVMRIAGKIATAFPSLDGCEVSASSRWGQPQFAHLREADAAIATLWTSAYPLLRFNRAQAKFFFVQDYEPLFYPAGSASALVEQTYRFGFPGLVNTPGLARAYREFGNRAVSFVPAVDTHRYYPPSSPRPERPVRIFFYGRPATPRNAFGLGIAALAKVKERYGDAVDIVCAGEDWNPGALGVADRIRNLGRLSSLDEVARLYRTCHIGVVFMLTKHPSYQPFEFMASGMACVTNENPYTTWLLRHGDNALTAPAAPSLIADRIGALVDDASLRQHLTSSGLATVTGIHWGGQIDRVWAAMVKSDQAAWESGSPVPGLQTAAGS